MDSWKYWNRDQAAPEEANQDNYSNDLYQQAQQFIAQNNLEDQPAYYSNEGTAANEGDQAASAYLQDQQIQQQESNAYPNYYDHQGPYSRQQYSSMGSNSSDPINVDAFAVSGTVARRPGQYQFQRESSQPPYQGTSYVPPNNRAMGSHQSTFQNNERDYAAVHSSLYAQQGMDPLREPVSKRMRTEYTDDSLALFQGQERSFSSVMASEVPSQEKNREIYHQASVGGNEVVSNGVQSLETSRANAGARLEGSRILAGSDSAAEGLDANTMRDMDDIIDSIFVDDPSRDSFATAVSAAAFRPNTSERASATVNDGSRHAEREIMSIDEGIFDDADDDIELPVALRQTVATSALPWSSVRDAAAGTTQMEPNTDLSALNFRLASRDLEPLGKSADESQSGNVRRASDALSEANESTFSDAADDATIQVIETAKANAKTENKDKKVKKKQKPKPKLPLKKPIATLSAKEKAAADKLFTGKTDLCSVLPEEACRFLGKMFWIFTVQQFQHVFDASSDSYDDPKMISLRQEIRNELAIVVKEEEAKSTNNDVTGLEPTARIVSLLCMPKDGTETGLATSQSTAPVSASVTGVHSSLEELGDSEESDRRENETGETNGDAATEAIIESRGESSVGYTPIVDNSEENPLSFDPANSSEEAASEILVQEGRATAGFDSMDAEGANKVDAMLPQKHSSSIDHEDVPSKILESWVNGLAKWKQDGALSLKDNTEDNAVRATSSFSLQGPLGVLLPEILHNFLASISVSNAYDLLSVRFTESSPGIQALIVWRHLCGLESLKAAVLARHMAGIAMRLEKALSSVPPVDAYTRTWMGTALVCLTASAKEFLIGECKLQSAQDFLDTRTTFFSEKLVTWRASKQKSVLKGSGRVAMISSFKAHVRDSMAAEDTKNGPGRVTSEDELIELSKTIFPSEITETKDAVGDTSKQSTSKKKKKSKKTSQDLTESQRQASEAALSSTEFLQKALRPENVEFLASQGIHTPGQLMQTDKNEETPLVAEMIKWKTARTGKQALANSCARLLFDWQMRVKDELQRAARGDTEKESIRKRPRMPDVERTDTKKPSPKRTRPRANKHLGDALNVLSNMALRFLDSIDITTADDFLSTRTSNIAKDFMAWREQEKMTALKGTGHSATISGWKAAVRKAAESMGDDDLAMTDPYSDDKRPPRLSRESSTPTPRSSQPPTVQIDFVSHPRLLWGSSKRRFFVRDSDEDQGVYDFELSVRKSTTGVGVYLTYLGRKQLLASSPARETERHSLSCSADADRPSGSFLPVLQDAGANTNISEASTDTFVTSRPGCGLIEVGQYGAIPLSSEDEPKVLSDLEQFLHKRQPAKESKVPSKECRLDCSKSNVLVEDSPENGTSCFFYASEPLEKGQTIELRFSPRRERPCEESMAEPFLEIADRLSLARKLPLLPFIDLKAVFNELAKVADKNKRDIESCKVHEQQGDNSQLQGVSHDPNEEFQFLILQRRIHWMATQLLQSLEDYATKGEGTSAADRNALIEQTKKLLMTAEECRTLGPYAKRHDEDFLLKELSSEILCDAVLSNPTMRWSDKSAWCDFSTNLLNQCLHQASVHLLNCLCGEESRHAMLIGMDSNVDGAVKRVVSGDILKELAFPVRSEFNEALDTEFVMENLERLPKDVVVKASQLEAYKNAMDLCDEVSYASVATALQERPVQTLLVLATKSPWSPRATIMRSIEDVQKGNAQLDTKWYIEDQILSVAHAIASSKVLWSTPYVGEEARPDLSYDRFAQVARQVLEADTTGLHPPAPEISREMPENNVQLKFFPVVSEGAAENKAVPSTLPLFLAVVWPRLKSVYGFSIEVGDDPDDLTFFPPGHKGQFQRASDRQLRAQRLERARKRMKIEQQVKEVGFGNLPKLTKRTFISATRDSLESEHGTGVNDTIKQFVTSVLSDLSDRDDSECRRRLTAIEQAMNECFDKLIPSMLPEDVDPKESASLDAAHLMQVLLVLPSLLEQSGLPMRQIEDTLGVIRDVANYVASRNGQLFAEPLRLCHETYEAGRDVPHPFLLSRMQQLVPKVSAEDDTAKAEGSRDPTLIRELITPEDKRELTGFIGTVLSQFLPCRATEYDSSSRARKGIKVGHPGIMCRHCVGKSNEGKYYFTSLDSLNTAATGTLGHLYKCPNMPQELKERIAELKTRHSQERLALRKGAQAQFYSQLWKRLWSKDGIPDAPVVLANHKSLGTEDPELTEQKAAQDAALESPLEFNNHLDLLQYLATTPLWSDKADLQERIEQYYHCIAFGGQVYHTNVMPTNNFGSEWILSQMVPPERLSTKRLYLSG